MSEAPLLLLGCGYVGRRIAERATAARRVIATTRGPAGPRPDSPGIEYATVAADGSGLERLPPGCDVVVTFPPDGRSDALLAAQLPTPRALVYLSSTAVYGATRGIIDGSTDTAPDHERGHRRLLAEGVWGGLGGTALRVPAIYGPGRGVHERLRAGTHRMTGDGGGRISRIHVDDLVSFVFGALRQQGGPRALVIGDRRPCPQREIVGYICERLALELPEASDIGEASPTLRGDRAVDPADALAALGVELRHPSYREGLQGLLDRSPTP